MADKTDGSVVLAQLQVAFLWDLGFDLNIFYCFNIYMYEQKGRATSFSNISYDPFFGSVITRD